MYDEIQNRREKNISNCPERAKDNSVGHRPT